MPLWSVFFNLYDFELPNSDYPHLIYIRLYWVLWVLRQVYISLEKQDSTVLHERVAMNESSEGRVRLHRQLKGELSGCPGETNTNSQPLSALRSPVRLFARSFTHQELKVGQ